MTHRYPEIYGPQLSTWSSLEYLRNRVGVGLTGGMREEGNIEDVDHNVDENWDDGDNAFDGGDNESLL